MRILSTILLCYTCFACTLGSADGDNVRTSGGSSFAEQKLENYIKLYKQLKEKAPKTLEQLNEDEVDIKETDGYVAFEKIISENGMTYPEFVELNAKVGTIYSFSEINMQTFNEMEDMNQAHLEPSIKDLQKLIDDPNTPESQKAALRNSIEQLKSGKEQFAAAAEANKDKKMDMVRRAQQKLGGIATESEIMLVNKYQKELKAAFEGVFRPGKRERQTF